MKKYIFYFMFAINIFAVQPEIQNATAQQAPQEEYQRFSRSQRFDRNVPHIKTRVMIVALLLGVTFIFSLKIAHTNTLIKII